MSFDRFVTGLGGLVELNGLLNVFLPAFGEDNGFVCMANNKSSQGLGVEALKGVFHRFVLGRGKLDFVQTF